MKLSHKETIRLKLKGSEMTAITLDNAQANLSQLIHKLNPGEEVVITENDQPVAKLVAAEVPVPKKPRQLGTMKGTVLYMAPDFDAPCPGFEEYMQ